MTRKTRFLVTMEFEVEVLGGQVPPVAVMREAGNIARATAGLLIRPLIKATGRASVSIPESGTSLGRTKCVMPGEVAADPFLPVTKASLKYRVKG